MTILDSLLRYPLMASAKERIDSEITDDRFQAVLHEQRFDFVLKQFTRVESILEIGTGTGTLSPRLESQCDHYTGLEYDQECVSLTTRRLAGKGEVMQGDARCLPFESGSFAVVVCLEVLEHLGDWEAGVKEIQRCLKQPEGLAVISIPYRIRGGKSETNQYHLYEPGESEFVRCLRAKFHEVRIRYQYFAETLGMRVARRFHIRRLFGLNRIYQDLSAGQPEAVSRLRVGRKGRGWRLHLIAVVQGPKP